MILNLPDMRCRAKRFDNKEWVIGFLVTKTIGTGTEYYIVPDAPSESISVDSYTLLQKMVRVNRVTLGLSTGRTDVNGNLIFTGDLIETTDHEDCLYIIPWRTLVIYNEEKSCFYGDGPQVSLDEDEFYFCKIIGNMFDNKELFEEDKEIEEG